MLNAPEEKVLKKSSIIGLIPTMEKEYTVSFDVKVNSYVDAVKNVLHITTNDDIAIYGSRNPAVWFFESTSDTSIMHICAAINGNKNNCYNSVDYGISVGEWVNVKISQILYEGAYLYHIAINDQVVHLLQNDDARMFTNVKIYASNPWHAQLDGSIRNILVNPTAGTKFLNVFTDGVYL